MADAVTRMADLPDPDDVDLDLDAEDTLLREAIGQPITVRVAGKIITFPHPSDWPHTANTAAGRADFDAWAAEVLDEDDLVIWKAAKLRNYQINAVFEKVQRVTGVTPGKPRNSGPSSGNKRRR